MFSFSNISQFHQELRENKYTCAQVVEYYLEQIRANSSLNAFVDIYAEEARQKAIALDNSRSTGSDLKKLHGVVIAIKDVICYKGHKVTAASGILKDFTSLFTATALQHLIDEDAIIIGNCNCDEFAMGSSNENSIYGSVLNPVDNSRVSGGSSGGSAVAVSAGMCMLSLGSDTGGSVRQPADFCGVVGIKPSYGTISRYGLIAYASSFDQIGIFGKTVDDVALALSIMHRNDPRDGTMDQSVRQLAPASITDSEKYRFCYFKNALHHPSLDEEIAGTFLGFVEKLRSDGHTVTEIDFKLLDYVVPAYYVLTTAEASSNLSRYDGIRFGPGVEHPADVENMYVTNRTNGFGAEVKRRIMLGTFVLSSGYYDEYFTRAQKIRALLVKDLNMIFADFDAILSPTSPDIAPMLNSQRDPLNTYLSDIYTVIANLGGLPAISLPLFSHSYMMPFGLQVMTNKQDELSLLLISKLLSELNCKDK